MFIRLLPLFIKISFDFYEFYATIHTLFMEFQLVLATDGRLKSIINKLLNIISNNKMNSLNNFQ